VHANVCKNNNIHQSFFFCHNGHNANNTSDEREAGFSIGDLFFVSQFAQIAGILEK
jgi:hypothetical protein